MYTHLRETGVVVLFFSCHWSCQWVKMADAASKRSMKSNTTEQCDMCRIAYAVQVSFVSVERFLREVRWLLMFWGMDMVRMYGGCCVISCNIPVSPRPLAMPEMEKVKPVSLLVLLHSQNSRSWKLCSSSGKNNKFTTKLAGYFICEHEYHLEITWDCKWAEKWTL